MADGSSGIGIPTPRQQIVSLPLSDDILPHALKEKVGRHPVNGRKLVVTVSELPQTDEPHPCSLRADGEHCTIFDEALLRAHDHLVFVHLAERSQPFQAHLAEHTRALRASAIVGTPTGLQGLASAYEEARLALRLITAGLAAPRSLAAALPVTEREASIPISPETIQQLTTLLGGLANEAAARRLRHARTLNIALSGQLTYQQIAHALDISASTVSHHLNQLHRLLGPNAFDARTTVLLIAVLPRLIHLWQGEVSCQL